MLSADSIAHRYGAAMVLRAPDLQLARNEHCVLLGASGTGKTTLLHALAGILQPVSGSITLDGQPLYPRATRDDRWRASRIGLVPQRLHLLASISALDNVRLARYLADQHAHDDAPRSLLSDLGLHDRLHARPGELSNGEQQRVAVARAIVNRPRLLLADEPTSSLDDANAAQAIDLLFDAARISDALLIVATHDARIRDRFARQIQLQKAAP